MWVTALILFSVISITMLIWLVTETNAKNKLIESQKNRIEELIQFQTVKENRIKELEFELLKLSGIVSHDLRTPFNRIFALIQLTQKFSDNLHRNQQEYLSKIHVVIADGLAMIRNLTDYQKLEGKGIDFNYDTINLSSLLELLVKNYKVLSEIKKIQLHLKVHPYMMVYTDKYWLYRILDNIVSNAVKFSAEGSNIFIETLDEGTHMQIAVRDEGPGICEDDQKGLYKMFQPLTARPTGGETSTGLGLAIAKSLAGKMEVELSCASKLCEATTFTLRIRKEKTV
jgi:signal transduction histidine kinase